MSRRAEPKKPSAARRPSARGKARATPRHGPASGTIAPDPRILATMERELARSMEGLRVPGAPKTYFVQYSLRHVESLELRAAYGSLTRKRARSQAHIWADIRVGSRRFDNVLDGGLDDDDDRESLDWLEAPDDLDPGALAVALWKLTQVRYDEAIEDYYEHRKETVTEFLRDEVDSLTREEPLVFIERFSSQAAPIDEWGERLGRLSRRFAREPHVYDPAIALRLLRVRRWIVTSEGTRVVTEDTYVEASVGGWVLTEDGVYVEAVRDFHRRSIDAAPGEAELEGAIAQVLADLGELAHAKSPGSFIGPALLKGQAASTMFHEALGHRLEGERLVARGETRTFAQRVGDVILPVGLSVYDDPTLTEVDGQPLLGSYRVDDQGVRASRAELVERGRLRGFLRSRAPIPGTTRATAKSNGHGRHDGVRQPMARMANLVVEGDPAQALDDDALEQALIDIARQQGRRHAIIIARVAGGETSTNSYDFQVFKGDLAEVWLVDVRTGKRRRIRDVELIGTPLSALQRIVAFGRRRGIDQGYCVAESGSVPVSGVAPAILLSEVELQQKSSRGFHEPLLPPPFADDGSRGRRGGGRKRGRRQPAAS